MKRFLDFRFTHNIARRWTAGAAAVLIVFSQVAVAAHACPLPTSSTPPPAVVSASAHDCDSPSDAAEASALCKQHCENGQQNVVKSFALDISTAVLVAAVPLPAATAVANSAISPVYVSGAPPPSPPFLKSSILRI